jgi:hypothetical protein
MMSEKDGSGAYSNLENRFYEHTIAAVRQSDAPEAPKRLWLMDALRALNEAADGIDSGRGSAWGKCDAILSQIEEAASDFPSEAAADGS